MLKHASQQKQHFLLKIFCQPSQYFQNKTHSTGLKNYTKQKRSVSDFLQKPRHIFTNAISFQNVALHKPNICAF